MTKPSVFVLGSLLLLAIIIGGLIYGVFPVGKTVPDAVAGHDGGLDSRQKWQRGELVVEGTIYEVHFREHDPPLPLSRLMQALPEFSRQTALGIVALSIDLGRQVENERDFAAMSQLFENPSDSMDFYRQVMGQHEDWQALAQRTRSVSQQEYTEMTIAGEVIIGDCYVFVITRPETDTTFRVVKRNERGEYRHVNDWGPQVQPVLFNGRVLDLFETLNRYGD